MGLTETPVGHQSEFVDKPPLTRLPAHKAFCVSADKVVTDASTDY